MRRYRLLTAILALSFLFVFAPAHAAYAGLGQDVDHWNWSQTSPDSGCFFSLHMYGTRRALVYCEMRNRDSGQIIYKSNYTSYQCTDYSGCDPEGYISGWGDQWECVGIMLVNDDDYDGAAGHIRWAGPL